MSLIAPNLRRLPLQVSILFILLFTGCAFRSISTHKNIVYTQNKNGIPPQQLNIFFPDKKQALKEVIVFIHGGNWNSGNKSQYTFLGSRFARKGVVAVIIDYPLSPDATYSDMGNAAAEAVLWVKQNISRFGGNPDKISVSGHSAGGHLAALIAVKEEYFKRLDAQNPIKGVILIDAAGLDMYGYLKEQQYQPGNTYLKTFTNLPESWKEASPLYHLHSGLPPFLIYQGEKTYSSIAASNKKFISALKPLAPATTFKVLPDKKHIGMITQFLNPWNPLYDEIIMFLQNPEGSIKRE